MSALADIEIDSLVAEYPTGAGNVRALDGVDLEIAGGSSVAIVGPSGCGKSTLLGLLGGLDVPTSGAIRIGDRPISTMSDRDRAGFRRGSLGFVYQADNLLPFLTVAENVSLQLALNGDPVDANGRCMAMLTMLGLADKAGRLPDQLSGGQRQRVAVARAVVGRPDVILADEPTGALDGSNASLVVDLLLRAQAEIGASLVMVTHDAGSAERLDRVVTLRDGVVIADSGRAHAR